MILFTQDGCLRCAELAARLQAAGVELDAVPGLRVYDYGTVEGAAAADEHDIVAFPTLLEWRDAANWHCTSDVDEIVEILTTKSTKGTKKGEGDAD